MEFQRERYSSAVIYYKQTMMSSFERKLQFQQALVLNTTYEWSWKNQTRKTLGYLIWPWRLPCSSFRSISARKKQWLHFYHDKTDIPRASSTTLALHVTNHLVAPNDALQRIFSIELLTDILSEAISNPAGRQLPSRDFIRIGPQKVAEASLLVLSSRESSRRIC